MASYMLFLYYKSPTLQFQVIWNTFYGAFVRIALANHFKEAVYGIFNAFPVFLNEASVRKFSVCPSFRQKISCLKSFVALFYSAESQKQTRGETIMSMTPMNNFDYLERVKFSEELAEIEVAKKASGMTYEELAEKIGVNKVWLTSAIKGQQYVPEEYCLKLAEILGIDSKITMVLSEHPYKGNTDPVLYRLHEVLDTYGPAIKEIIHEKGGNAIMSAIDFGIDVDIQKDPHGDRVIITWNGKLLPYSKQGQYPW